jgi:ZIP family zinc transporter
VLEAALWGFLTAGSLWVGAAIAIGSRPGKRWIGLAIAFGSGALIAAVAYELVLEAFETSVTYAATGFAAGAVAFYAGDWIIDRRGGHDRKLMERGDELAGAANAIVLGTVLDGIPESFVLGASLRADGSCLWPWWWASSSPTSRKRCRPRVGFSVEASHGLTCC